MKTPKIMNWVKNLNGTEIAAFFDAKEYAINHGVSYGGWSNVAVSN